MKEDEESLEMLYTLFRQRQYRRDTAMDPAGHEKKPAGTGAFYRKGYLFGVCLRLFPKDKYQ